MKTTWTPVACLALILAACILTSGLQADPSIRFVQRVRAAKSELEPYLDPDGPYKDDINLPDGGGTLEALLSNCNYTGASHISRFILGTVQYYNGTIREQFFLNSIEGECTYEDSDGKSGVVSVRSDSVQFQILIHPGVKNVTLLPEIRHGTLAIGHGFLDLASEMVNFIGENYEKSIRNLIKTLIDKYWD